MGRSHGHDSSTTHDGTIALSLDRNICPLVISRTPEWSERRSPDGPTLGPVAPLGDNRFDEHLLVTQREVGADLSRTPWRSLRLFGWASLFSGLLWLWGLGSVFAIGFGLIGIVGRHQVAAETYPPPGLRLCVAGVVLGAVGLAAAIALVL